MKTGRLYVVSAPSGCGKGTILARVFAQRDNLFYSVSATTRAPREGEQDGVHYHFLTTEEFTELIADGGVLEYASYCGNYYGTPKKQVLEKLQAGSDVILEIETQGALQIKKAMPEAVLIFILPPSVSELRRRLNKRRTETDEVIEKRVAEAAREISAASEYDYVMVNADLDRAIEDFKAILTASKLTKSQSEILINEVLNNA
ncbi:MAG: guanylate kinase [Oscillospiraceae bacterium]